MMPSATTRPVRESGDGERKFAVIEHGGEDDEDQKKGSRSLPEPCRPAREVAREFGGAQGDGAPGVVGNDGFQEEGGGDGARQLRDPVEEHVESVQALGDPEADGDCGIEMAAGDVAEGGNHDGQGEAVSESDADEADIAGAVEELVSAESAFAEKDQGERAEKFGGKFLRVGVHAEGFRPTIQPQRNTTVILA